LDWFQDTKIGFASRTIHDSAVIKFRPDQRTIQM